MLLVVHGLAGCLWGPAEQMMLYDFAGREQLPSAVRINATFRSLGILFGPVVGSVLLLLLGPTGGIFFNIVFYLPLTIFLMRTPFTGHTRSASPASGRVSLWASFRVLGTVRRNHVITGMLILAALASVTIGAVLQTAMPVFGARLTPVGTDGELVYGALLFALGIGGVLGGFFLEASGWFRPTPTTAVVSAVAFGGFAVLFAFTGSMIVAVVALVLTGVAQITATSTGQALVQARGAAGRARPGPGRLQHVRPRHADLQRRDRGSRGEPGGHPAHGDHRRLGARGRSRADRPVHVPRPASRGRARLMRRR
ncbi:MFS transporter [Microbacterium elymi]|uniref:MFS transporter n=1 Tax=Microbacterium elymi TaxID=2909587 RepID=A0ABY5NKH6_9MICO|nr:MFS transporter [Microbacterium elymi]UUT35667.1 MFS transporter [Microbacterium elymi]